MDGGYPPKKDGRLRSDVAGAVGSRESRGTMQSHASALIARVSKCGLLIGAATLSGCVLARPARTAPLTPPPELTMEAVSFPSRSGSDVRGWFLRGVPGEGAVLLLHGVGDNRTSMVARARFLHRAGYSVLLPDFQ